MAKMLSGTCQSLVVGHCLLGVSEQTELSEQGISMSQQSSADGEQVWAPFSTGTNAVALVQSSSSLGMVMNFYLAPEKIDTHKKIALSQTTTVSC